MKTIISKYNIPNNECVFMSNKIFIKQFEDTTPGEIVKYVCHKKPGNVEYYRVLSNILTTKHEVLSKGEKLKKNRIESIPAYTTHMVRIEKIDK